MIEAVQILLQVCGGISIVVGAGVSITKLIAPAFSLSNRVKKLEQHDASDNERIKNLETMQKNQSKGMAAMMNHMIDGNGIDNLKKTRDELLASIIEN